MGDVSIPNVDVGGQIGRGTFGRVFKGRHRILELDVAVKLINASDISDSGSALKEARLMARLDHPNLLRIFDAGRCNGDLYLVLELMDGTSNRSRPLSADAAVDITRQLLAGLQALHDARVLHRDIKPANCLVRSRDGRVKLADLGIAVEQSTISKREHDLAGTLPFMAPELFDNPPRFSHASDLYALGRTLQCLVLDSDPFPSGSTGAVLAWIRDGAITPSVAEARPDLPRPLALLIDRLCASDAGTRPADAADAITDLSLPPSQAIVTPATGDTSAIVGSWIVGAEVTGDANFNEHAVTHVRTGAGGRLAWLKRRCPLSGMSSLILASAERASQLFHPGIAAVVDWGLHDGRAYVVTRSQGRSLEALVASSGPVGEVEALAMVRDLADALTYLHAAGLVYQVVNPLFELLAADGRTVQLAWPMFCVPAGSVPASPETTLLISVPLFAAPESLTRPSRSAEPTHPPPRIDERADLYGLGQTLFYLIAGRPASSRTAELPALVFEKVRGPVQLREAVPAVSAPTAQIVAELTAPDPHLRPASAESVRDRLQRIIRGLTPTQRP